MDILKAEIMKKRKQLEESNILHNNKKYFRRGELAAKEQEEYLEKYGHKKDTVKSDVSDHSADSVANNGQEHLALSRPEVIRRLRERGEPVLLFGESELEAFRRLRKREILEPEVNKGFRNDFQEAMEQVDQAYLDEIFESSKPQDGEGKGDVHVPDEGVTYDDIQKMSAKLNCGDREYDMNVITQFLQFLVKMWGNQLNSRAAMEKNSTRGKMASATYAQTREYLKPLLRKLKNKSLPEDITDSLTEIVKHLLERNYILASDAYLQMAIGNSPWPIGVTMVGIHARTGREKIFSKNVAHVMNDETQRKYIQALKRLMTKCQEYYPTDPSRCVEYAKTN
ncbi:pre-mRNA-splicing factor 18 [Neodiprion pinetum]|uniref:pre-mRNA-splicing factor 18 n=1 Tax=Neodiprion fabricii TaxID=2872261 RepID=UPI00076F9F9A|nr:pre-mRNA-splicing factor 18 [Neodiprion fabricii]XP_046489093.1 pre-mRNA-splicing factor 18 [Neodiprion pinetum]XP_046740603.1 pre-mRNA-splicing factor 18 [Diprion similis]